MRPQGEKQWPVAGFPATERAERTLPPFVRPTCPGVVASARPFMLPRLGGHFVSSKQTLGRDIAPMPSWCAFGLEIPASGVGGITRNQVYLHYGDIMENTLKTHRFTVRLSKRDINNLHAIAAREGFSPSVIVRHLIVRFLDNRLAMGGGHANA